MHGGHIHGADDKSDAVHLVRFIKIFVEQLFGSFHGKSVSILILGLKRKVQKTNVNLLT